MDNRWIPIPDSVISITKVFPYFDGRQAGDILFDPQAQFNMTLVANFANQSLIPYYMGRQYQQLVNDVLPWSS
jgi:hypothetical protein